MVTLRVPGSTSNLGSGFDTFGLALGLYLQVEMDYTDGPTRVEVHGEGAGRIALDESNLIAKAARRLFERTGQPFRALRVGIHNEIPLCRGLGSSGAAIVAGLVGANALSGGRLPKEALLNLAVDLEGHPENAAASLFGGFTVNCTREGGVLSKKFLVPENLKLLLLIPEREIATEEARRILPETIPHRDAVFNVQRAALTLAAFSTGDWSLLRVGMEDRLHQPYRRKLLPEFDALVEAGYAAGALGVCLSGSGSAVLAFAEQNEQRILDALQQTASAKGLKASARTIKVDNEGVQVKLRRDTTA